MATLTPQEKFEAFKAKHEAKTQTVAEPATTEPAPAVEGQRARPDHPDLTWDQRFDAALAIDYADDDREEQIEDLLEERSAAAREAEAATKAHAPKNLPPARESSKEAVEAVADEIATLEAQLADPQTSKVDTGGLMLQLDQARHTARIYDQRLPHSGLTDDEVSRCARSGTWSPTMRPDEAGSSTTPSEPR